MARRRRKRRFTRRAGRFVLKALLLLLLVTLIPVLSLRWLNPPVTSYMLLRHFGTPFERPPCAIEYRWTDWRNISPDLALAVIAAEDQRFPRHHGLDFEAISDAIRERMDGGRIRGGSTISQQLAKNLFLWPERSWLRKALEAYLTVLIELSWPKQRILEVYLNVVQFGDCTFGVEAASRKFFHESAAGVTRQQAALLAAALPNPSRFQVDEPSAYLRERAAWILRQMDSLGGPAYLRQLDASSGRDNYGLPASGATALVRLAADRSRTTGTGNEPPGWIHDNHPVQSSG